MSQSAGEQSVELTIGGFPKEPEQNEDAEMTHMLQNLSIASSRSGQEGQRTGNDSTAWNIQVPPGVIAGAPAPVGYSFGTNNSRFIYPPPRQFGMEQGSNRSSPTRGTTTPRGTPRTPQKIIRDTPPHQSAQGSQSSTPPGLNQTGVRFDSQTRGAITSTAQPQRKSKDVLRLPEFTKGDTEEVRTNANSLQHERVQVQPLTEIGEPLAGILTDPECYCDVKVEFYSCMEEQELKTYPIYSKDLLQRRDEALRIGKAYLLQRKFRDNSLNQSIKMTQQQYDDMKDLRRDLTRLLTHLDRYEDEYVTGYKLNAEYLREFNKHLLELRTATRNHVVLSGEGLQDLPCWGLNGNINEYWESNDFEILATCYRYEVTRYLLVISRAIEDSIPVINEVTATISRIKEQELTQLRAAAAAEARDDNEESREPHQEKSLFYDAPTPIAHRIQNFTNQNASIFGNPSKHTSSKKLASMLSNQGPHRQDQTIGVVNTVNIHSGLTTKYSNKPDISNRGHNPGRFPGGSGGPDDGPGGGGPGRGNSGKGNGNGGHKGGPGGGGSGGSGGGGSGGGGSGGGDNGPPNNDPNPQTRQPGLPQFDNKLKVDMIPTWNGNPDELARWIIKVNRLSERSPVVFQQLGYLVPTRLTGSAELWYYSQSAETRSKVEEDWGKLRNVIAGYYMNRSFLEKQRIRANKARYREIGHNQETPSEYFIRKLELLEIVYNYSEGELINEIMAGAPTYWSTVLTPHLYDSIEGFQMAVKFQEDNLLRMGYDSYKGRTSPQENSRNPFNAYRSRPQDVRTNAVGWSQNAVKPPFPKDDDNISPRGTPISKGGRPCRHCGSDNHWDPECKYARKGEKRARANMATISPEDLQAQKEYDDLFYSTIEDDSEKEDFQ